jgi:aminoglycoside 3-N-acetyltransferase I
LDVSTRRLTAQDTTLARQLFALMAEVFGEPHVPLGDAYLQRLLASEQFWAMVALADGVPVGGLTAHGLAMTRNEATEAFIYDIAVLASHQRQGVGRALVLALRAACAEHGIHVLFVGADDADTHALDFYRAIGGEASPVTFFTFEGRHA